MAADLVDNKNICCYNIQLAAVKTANNHEIVKQTKAADVEPCV